MKLCAQRCGQQATCRGMCSTCYQREYRTGRLKVNAYGRPTPEYFFEKVDVLGVCWEWGGRLDRDGYGEFSVLEGATSKKYRAHRWCWAHLVGPIPKGMVLDHLCLNRACVMPDHLEVVTPVENNRRGRELKLKGIKLPGG